jgi:leader peptidase (prepilin peptidase)/N-methyltransferase
MEIFDFFVANPDIYLAVMVVLSLLVGSFLNVVIYRLPIMMERNWSEECRIYLGLKPHEDTNSVNLCLPSSHCPQCKQVIKPWHNIPLVSYFLLRGKCSACHAHISIRYPLVEAATCFMSVYVAWKFGVSWQALAALFFTWICITLTFIDIDHHILPDQLTLLLLWIGLLSSIFSLFCNSTDAIIGAIAGYLIFAATQMTFERVTGKAGMGQGDVKFLAALGGFLGWQMLPLIIILASFTGLIFALTHMISKQHFKSIPLPFGPYLALAGWIALVWGNELMQHYYEIML